MNVPSNLERLLLRIRQTAEGCGRAAEEISLVAVTKGCPLEQVQQAYWAGCRDFGENRVQEALEKMPQLPSDVRWHFIGKLQSNKINKVLGKFALIHSIDSIELVEKLSRAGEQEGIVTRILLEANTSGEESKSGLPPEEWKVAFPSLLDLKGIEILGLMTMAPLTEDEAEIRNCFHTLTVLRDDLQAIGEGRVNLETLSMGMSHDFHLAIEEGATLLRIGTALFAPS